MFRVAFIKATRRTAVISALFFSPKCAIGDGGAQVGAPPTAVAGPTEGRMPTTSGPSSAAIADSLGPRWSAPATSLGHGSTTRRATVVLGSAPLSPSTPAGFTTGVFPSTPCRSCRRPACPRGGPTTRAPSTGGPSPSATSPAAACRAASPGPSFTGHATASSTSGCAPSSTAPVRATS